MEKLSDLLKCVRPLLFEDGVDGFEYSGSGTFFFGRYSGKFYGITAKHCLRNRDKEKIRLFVNDSSADESFIPTRTVHEIENPSEGAVDWADLAFMELSDERLTEAQKKAPWFLDFDYLTRVNVKFQINDLLMTRGCPDCLREIDYDFCKIKTGFFSADGSYGGRSIEPRCHIFRFSDLTQIQNPNGMSGSPVLKLKQHSSGLDYWFAGVLLRSTSVSGIAHFVDCGAVFAALQALRESAPNV